MKKLSSHMIYMYIPFGTSFYPTLQLRQRLWKTTLTLIDLFKISSFYVIHQLKMIFFKVYYRNLFFILLPTLNRLLAINRIISYWNCIIVYIQYRKDLSTINVEYKGRSSYYDKEFQINVTVITQKWKRSRNKKITSQIRSKYI